MSQTQYNVEIKFEDSKRWEYIAVASTIKYAMYIASRHIRQANRLRIRRVVKTIVWTSKKGREKKV